MHEYAVTKSIINTVIEEAKKAEVTRVTEIKLVIGDLSTIVDESVQMYFDIIGEGTMVQGAKLIFKRIHAEFCCKACGNVFVKPDKGFDCPQCGGLGIITGVGKEFYIESIEAE